MKIVRLAAVCALAAPVICFAATTLSDASRRQLVEKYETSPILFVENRGQAPEGIDFVSSGLGRRIVTRSSGADIYFPGKTPDTLRTISIGFDKANPAARGQAVEPTDTRSGFLYNGKSVDGLIDYRKVQYKNVWSGIDVVYYGNGRELEYDFVLQPGADLSKVKLHFGGLDSLSTNAGGDLVLDVAGRQVIQHRPRIYQQAGDRRVEIQGQYRLDGKRGVSLEIAKYDRSKSLVVDPIISYHDSPGFPLVNANGIAVDANGNAFLTGQTAGLGQGGETDFFIIKLDPTGNKVSSFEAGGAAGNTQGNAVAVDPAGNVYVVGQTKSPGLVVCSTCFQNTIGGGWDGFLIEFTNDLAFHPFITYIGGTLDDFAIAVAASGPSAVYVAGHTASSNFPANHGALAGTQNAFVMKFDTTQTGSSARVWGLFVGGSATETGYGLALDASGNTYLAGTTTSTLASFRPIPGGNAGFNTTRSTNTDGYLAKIDPAGVNITYFTYFSNGQASAVSVSGATAYVVGTAGAGLGNITANPYQLSFGGGNSDAFLFRVDTSQSLSNSLVYSTYLGGSGTDQATGVAADSNGKAYVVGFTNGNFPVKDAIQRTFGGGTNSQPFYAVLNTAVGGANGLLSSTYLDRGNSSVASAIALLGSTAYVSVFGQAAQAYKISPGTTSDFDQNNAPDLVWYSPALGRATVYYFGGTGGSTLQHYNYVAGNPGWHIVGVADYNNDGVPDIVWQNDSSGVVAVNYYGGANGSTFLGYAFLNQNPVAGWRVVAVADFDGNGVPDLVWQKNTGEVTVNYYGGANGTTILGWNYLSASPISGWNVVGAADFDGNGVPDLVWQNTTTRAVTVYYFGGSGGTTFMGYAFLDPGTPGWTVAKVADFDGNGVPDLVWQNDANNSATVYYYGGANGTTFLSYAWLQQAAIPGDWKIH